MEIGQKDKGIGQGAEGKGHGEEGLGDLERGRLGEGNSEGLTIETEKQRNGDRIMTEEVNSGIL